MKLKNLISKSLMGAALVTLSVGCSNEFLEDTNTKDLSESLVFGSEATAIAAVTAVYDGLQSDSQADPGLPNEYNVKGIFRFANNLSWDWQDSAPRGESTYDRFDLDPDGDVAVKIWPNNYRAIGRANVALANLRPVVADGSLPSELGNRLIGEVLTIRAISYQYLAAAYGDVPIVTVPGENAFGGRDPEAEVWNLIAKDMEEAIPLLPWFYENEKGRVTKATAYAVKGNAHMWLKEYDKAIAAFEEIEKGGVVGLMDNYLDIHSLKFKNNKESIFELQWAANGDLSWGRNDEVNILQLFAMPTDITGGGGFAGIPRKELYDSFEPGDLRRQATVIGPGEEHPDPDINIIDYEGVNINTVGTVADPWTGAPAGEPESPQRTGYWGIKSWRDPSITGWGRSVLFGSQGHIWIRFGEVLLSLAECYHKQGDDSKAMELVMRVRNRAWGGTAPAPTSTDGTMDIILEEYRHELGGEFSLYPVLRRSGELTAYLKKRYNVDLPAGRDVVPVPNNQLSINPNLQQTDVYK